MIRSRAAAALVCIALLSACGGGGGSSVPASAVPTSVPLAVPSGAASGTLTIVIPRRGTSAAGRAPKFISAGTASLSLAVINSNNVQISYQTFPLTTMSTNCTLVMGGLQCTLPFYAPPGTQKFVVDLIGTSGGIVGHGSVTQTIVATTQNQLNIPVFGVVDNYVAVVDPPVGGPPYTETVHVTSYDSEALAISGTLEAPLVVTGSGGATVSANSLTTSPATFTVTDSSPGTVTIATSSVITRLNHGVDITASASLPAVPGSVTIAPIGLIVGTASPVVAFPPIPTVAISGGVAPYSVTSGCGAAFTASVSSNTLTVTPTLYAAANSCFITVHDYPMTSQAMFAAGLGP